MGDGNDADHIALQPVNQGIWKAVECQSSRLARACVAQLGKLAQQIKRPIEFIGECICCDERSFAGVPIDSGFGIRLRLIAKADSHRLWRR